MMVSSVTLMMILTCLYSQMRTFNDFLSKVFVKPRNITNVQCVIRTSILHDSFCDCSDAISTFYTLTILTFFLGFLYFNIVFLFVIFALFQDFSTKLLYFSLSGIFWIFFYSPCIIWITTLSSWIEKEGLRTLNLLQLMIRDERKSKDVKRLAILVQQVTHRSPKIYCGMMDLNWKFFFTMLGAIFSFWIIIIQFYDVTH